MEIEEVFDYEFVVAFGLVSQHSAGHPSVSSVVIKQRDE